MLYEQREPYEEELADAERAPDDREYEPANDNAEIANDNERADTDSVDAKRGGEERDWSMADRGESGYTFDGKNVIGPDGASWLDAWGDSPENIALYEEMIQHFAGNEHVFQLPDHEERTSEGETLYKTFMLLNEDGTVGYDIQKYELSYSAYEDLPLFDDEGDDDEPVRLTESDEFPEPGANEGTEEEPYMEMAAAAEIIETVPQAEAADTIVAHETIEATYVHTEMAETAEMHTQTTEQEAPATAPTAREAEEWLVQLLEPVTYKPEREDRAEAEHTEPTIAEATVRTELFIRTDTSADTETDDRTERPEHNIVTEETHAIIPDLPVYTMHASQHAEIVTPAAEPREEAAHEPAKRVVYAVETVTSVAVAPTTVIETRGPTEQTQAASVEAVAAPGTRTIEPAPVVARVPQAEPRAREAETSMPAKVTPRERVIPPVPVRAPSARREAVTAREPLPRRVARESQRQNTERSRGSSSMTERYRRESVGRTARTETRAVAPVSAEIVQRALRGRPEPVHPQQQAARARWYVQAYGTENNNTSQPARNTASLNGITLKRAA